LKGEVPGDGLGCGLWCDSSSSRLARLGPIQDPARNVPSRGVVFASLGEDRTCQFEDTLNVLQCSLIEALRSHGIRSGRKAEVCPSVLYQTEEPTACRIAVSGSASAYCLREPCAAQLLHPTTAEIRPDAGAYQHCGKARPMKYSPVPAHYQRPIARCACGDYFLKSFGAQPGCGPIEPSVFRTKKPNLSETACPRRSTPGRSPESQGTLFASSHRTAPEFPIQCTF
jgi:hypothetical protein